MTPALNEARRLIRLAERDRRTVELLSPIPQADLASIGFHAQQAVEKALKAVLTWQGLGYGRTHNLEELSNLLADADIITPITPRDLRRLNPFAVEFRYDDQLISTISVEEARAMADCMLAWAAGELQ